MGQSPTHAANDKKQLESQIARLEAAWGARNSEAVVAL